MILKNKMLLRWLLIIVTFTSNTSSFAQNYLSNLNAAKDDPLYSTFAAALDNSQYIVDEGYQFVFYRADDGINFETEFDWGKEIP